MNHETIAILGAGSWGSALAHLLAGKGYPINLWDRNEERIAQTEALGETVRAVPLLKDAVGEADWVIVVVSSDGVRSVVSEAASFLRPQTAILSASKGLDSETGLTLSEVITQLLTNIPYAGIAVLSGPNLAGELVQGIPAASVVASHDPQIARAAQALLMTDRTFRVYTHSDVKGVELGGALKNVLAIGGGISDGLGYGDNTKAALMTRGLMEMTQLGVAAGGKALTFLGLSGVGDLMATAGSRLSRNYRVGLGLADRKPLAQIMAELHQAAEGVPTAHAAQILSKRYAVPTPVFAAINAVLHEGLSPIVAVEELMTRAARDEYKV